MRLFEFIKPYQNGGVYIRSRLIYSAKQSKLKTWRQIIILENPAILRGSDRTVL